MTRWRPGRPRAGNRVATVTRNTVGSALAVIEDRWLPLGAQMSTSEMAKQPDGSTGFWGTPGEMGVQGVYLARRARSSVPRVQERAAVTVCITDGNYCHSLTGSNSPSRAFVQKAREAPKTSQRSRDGNRKSYVWCERPWS